MTNFQKRLAEQKYYPACNMHEGDTICLSYGKYNGILKVKSMSMNLITRRTISSKFNQDVLKITTEKYLICITADSDIPRDENKNWIIRRIPECGQYSLMQGYICDMSTSSGKIVHRYCHIELIDKSIVVEKFDDPIKSYKDSKTKEIMTEKKTSHYSREHFVRYYDEKTKSYELKKILVQFDYNKSNFLIPYKYHDIEGNFVVPNDVTKIGRKCFGYFKYLDNIILPNHKVTFKAGALLGCNLIPMNMEDPIIDLKRRSFIVYGGVLKDSDILINYFNVKYELSAGMHTYSTYKRNTYIWINPSKLTVGMKIRFPVVSEVKFTKFPFTSISTTNATVMEVSGNNLVLDIGSYIMNKDGCLKVG